MPFHRPIPDSKTPAGSGRPAGVRSLVQAESLMQIALVMPCALVVGWGAGWSVDHFLHTHWGVVAGLILGIVAGMVSAIRMAMGAMHSLSGRGGK